ncbi:MAG: RecB-family nuclease [Desulfurococcales archaeon]|nr:RecB-family nuclease [Desulfurococcales archaeon]
MLPKNVMLVLNNTSSPSRVMDFIKIGSTMGVKEIVYTKIYGAAAQTGIPDAFKYAYKNGLSLLVMPTLEDFVETVKPSLTILFTGTGQELGEILGKHNTSESSTALVFDGSDAGFDPLEKKLGVQTYLKDVPGKLPVVAEVSLSLYILGKNGENYIED